LLSTLFTLDCAADTALAAEDWTDIRADWALFNELLASDNAVEREDMVADAEVITMRALEKLRAAEEPAAAKPMHSGRIVCRCTREGGGVMRPARSQLPVF